MGDGETSQATKLFAPDKESVRHLHVYNCVQMVQLYSVSVTQMSPHSKALVRAKPTLPKTRSRLALSGEFSAATRRI